MALEIGKGCGGDEYLSWPMVPTSSSGSHLLAGKMVICGKRFGFVKLGPCSVGGEPCSLESVHLEKIISGRAV